MNVSAVVCAFTEERWDLLLAALQSLKHQRPEPAEIIVVIDHNDRLLARLRRAADATVRCIPSVEVKGLSGARNTGVLEAREEIIAFLDDDAEAEPGWLAHLSACFDDPRVAAAGGASEPVWPSRRPRWFPPEFDWVVGSTYRGMPTRRAQVRNVIGSNMAFRRDLLKAGGGFSHRLGRVGSVPVGNEETEACIRMAALAPQSIVVYEPAARVRHHVSHPRTRSSYFLARCWGEGRSKAILTQISGRSQALATERRYVRRTLPAGVVRGLREAVHGDIGGLSRAGAIALGLAVTSAGYVTELVRTARPRYVAAKNAPESDAP